jgi:hypothetical protein
MTAIDKTFTWTLRRSGARGGWTYLVTEWSADSSAPGAPSRSHEPSTASPSPPPSWPLGDGTHKHPVRADLRARIDKQAGDTVTVHLTDRIDR